MTCLNTLFNLIFVALWLGRQVLEAERLRYIPEVYRIAWMPLSRLSSNFETLWLETSTKLVGLLQAHGVSVQAGHSMIDLPGG